MSEQMDGWVRNPDGSITTNPMLGWSMAAFGPGASASKKLIDAVVPDRPVIVASRDGHSSWANSKAIEIAGITNETPDPPDGRIDRDPKTGEAIGSFQEGGDALIRAKQPPPTDAQRDAGLRYAIKMLNGFGITGIQDASVNEEDLKSYRRVDDAGYGFQPLGPVANHQIHRLR